MEANHPYTFRKATMDDLPLLGRWQANTHVLEWWEDKVPFNQKQLKDPRVVRWVVLHGARPFAYMQDYAIHGWDGHHLGALPMGSRGIDQYIGEPDMIEHGHGTAFIGARLQTLFDNGAPAIGTDPHPDNARAIAAYRKVGFEAMSGPVENKWGRCLPMALRR